MVLVIVLGELVVLLVAGDVMTLDLFVLVDGGSGSIDNRGRNTLIIVWIFCLLVMCLCALDSFLLLSVHHISSSISSSSIHSALGSVLLTRIVLSSFSPISLPSL